MSDKKYYWLKLKRDFFKRHDIRIVESMPNGKDYILFYLKLLCESVDHDGNLRFSEQIPYSEEMLATITNTNIDIVRSAVHVFKQLNMMEVLDDGTLYMNEIERLIGSETEWAEKKRAYRAKIGQSEDNVLALSDKSKSKRQIQSKSKSNTFTPPTLDEVRAYCKERNSTVDAQRFIDYYTANGWVQGKGRKPIKDWKACLRTWEQRENSKAKTTDFNSFNQRTYDYDDLTERLAAKG